jgi:hypothetical protein
VTGPHNFGTTVSNETQLREKVQVNKQIFSMLSLGVFSVAIAGFGLPAEGGLFDFFRHHRGYSACGPCGVVECAPCGHVVCEPVCGGSCGYDYDDDDGWCGHSVCAPVCAPACAPVCACPPPRCPQVCDPCADWDDDDCDDDD